MTLNTDRNPLSVVQITGNGGTVREERWAHAFVQAQLTNASPAEIERVRELAQRIVAVMEGHGSRASDAGHVGHGGVLATAEATA